MTTAGTVQAPRRWSVAMRATTGAAMVAIAVMFVVDATHIDVLGWVLAVVMLLACGLSWMILAPIGCARYRQYRAVAVAPVVVILGAGLVWFGVPEKVGWWISAGSMTEAARNCPDSEGEWFGVIRTYSVRPGDGGCQFTIDDMAMMGGLAYFPPGSPPPDHGGAGYQPVYTPYDGNWYRFAVTMHDHQP
ncbi:hypothetical protein [Nocardia fluminea]|uniref:Uncharacterized protein n=1 Tax=Nocardia fluminea TaxID=134984 RepID=A0A2N3WWC7_9NOCA|nr:hypothetical protein [Nocardia fluminea]PKV98163.1 hypothetical protein ATK86_0171 [Nocardia fluminea]